MLVVVVVEVELDPGGAGVGDESYPGVVGRYGDVLHNADSEADDQLEFFGRDAARLVQDDDDVCRRSAGVWGTGTKVG